MSLLRLLPRSLRQVVQTQTRKMSTKGVDPYGVVKPKEVAFCVGVCAFVVYDIYTDRKEHLEVYLAHKDDRTRREYNRPLHVKPNMDFLTDEAYPAPKGQEADIIDRTTSADGPDWWQRMENRK